MPSEQHSKREKEEEKGKKNAVSADRTHDL